MIPPRNQPAPILTPAARDKRGEHYPGLVVMDGRVTGSVTLGQSRLPLWCLPARFDIGWHTGDPNSHGVTDDDLSQFTYNLFEMRKPWARLILTLADEHRMAMRGPGWFGESKRAKKRLRAALDACLADLESWPFPAEPPFEADDENREETA